MRVQDHYLAVPTHFQSGSYDTYSWEYCDETADSCSEGADSLQEFKNFWPIFYTQKFLL